MNVPIDLVLEEVATTLGRLHLELILERVKARVPEPDPEPTEEPNA